MFFIFFYKRECVIWKQVYAVPNLLQTKGPCETPFVCNFEPVKMVLYTWRD